jgi:hypothetical protein
MQRLIINQRQLVRPLFCVPRKNQINTIFPPEA